MAVWRRPALRPAGAGVLLGLLVGVPIGLLLGHHVDAGWLGAVAGAVVAIGTVGLWLDSRAHRHEERAVAQEERERRNQQDQADELRADADRARAVELREQAEVDEAALVTVELFGGGGYGASDPMRGDSIHFQISNGTTRPVTRISVGTEPGITFKNASDQLPPVIAAGESYRWTRDTHPYDLPRDEASGRPMLSKTPIGRFHLNGQPWQRLGDGAPFRLNGPGDQV